MAKTQLIAKLPSTKAKASSAAKQKAPGAPSLLARIPVRKFIGHSMSTLLSSMAGQAQRKPFHTNSYHAEHSRFVLGYPLPAWQRPLVWSEEQCVRFIQSVFSGVYLGLFVYNESLSQSPHLDGLLIDGQQRLYAIERYLAGELAVPGEDGKSYLWTDLTDEEKAHFYRVSFGFQIVQINNEEELKNLYNLLNFGGVAHTPDQRA